MSLKEILDKIEKDSSCNLIKVKEQRELPNNLPIDLFDFYSNYNGIDFFKEEAYGISIVPFEDFKTTNSVLFPPDDVIWEELEDDISQNWYLIAKSEQLSQYISIDLSEKDKGKCYDSFLETHANPDDSPIISNSFTELLEKIYSVKGKNWFWLESDFESYGDAYEGIEI
ncbi:SMI1/KNR4 family protein [Zobellia galactanivorans]|uniref:SMI1/KNR4 family protein n=1 Tax=Zobellia galactanivorans (strain DSM 12802 / CCUG 47099 / CIP 106680 / NCIMB 13871 / Dsij) TaxID=63186 RepID=UPI0026E3F37B|nr:SMI1/KNR4 family protein [Zobellia galactanivorans]MDO6811251.1 SMI1/KNR4 family protein [Zobellia galactanivorans]